MPAVEPQEGWLHETLSGASRFLNGVTGGDGAVTFSARCGHLAARGSPLGQALARTLDQLPFNGVGHCEASRLWHVERGLLPPTP
ncbi:hypothetical protein EAH89_17350 [Roseomonas nepalensis]|uniref:Uncharacterized protein n=1 Tax=Muricoccus nepalensis TaxID=1854500 RepID=A0A502FV10_9PROT|nr:hypothetical protein [Roseomonas nepalensis]TPG53284.1 hypothetical protein EAH89_17350 [Roseomonas nepalensis]